jgi:hypothetical protein
VCHDDIFLLTCAENTQKKRELFKNFLFFAELIGEMSQAFSQGLNAPPSGLERCPGAVMLQSTHSCGQSCALLGGAILVIHVANCQEKGQKCWDSWPTVSSYREGKSCSVYSNCWDG